MDRESINLGEAGEFDNALKFIPNGAFSRFPNTVSTVGEGKQGLLVHSRIIIQLVRGVHAESHAATADFSDQRPERVS